MNFSDRIKHTCRGSCWDSFTYHQITITHIGVNELNIPTYGMFTAVALNSINQHQFSINSYKMVCLYSWTIMDISSIASTSKTIHRFLSWLVHRRSSLDALFIKFVLWITTWNSFSLFGWINWHGTFGRCQVDLPCFCHLLSFWQLFCFGRCKIL